MQMLNKETIRSHAHPYAYIHTRARSRTDYCTPCSVRSSLQVQRTARLHNKRTTSSTSCNPPTAATGRPPPPQAPAITRQVTDASGPRIRSHPRSPTHPRRLSLTVCLGEWPSISPHASLCVSCNLTRLLLPPPNPRSCCAVAPLPPKRTCPTLSSLPHASHTFHRLRRAAVRSALLVLDHSP